MAKGLDIRRRIKSVKNTRSITKAMQMVAASKMRRAQETALKTRGYAEKALEILSHVSEKVGLDAHWLLDRPAGSRTLILLITSNKGLCGSLNANVIRKTLDHATKNTDAVTDFVTLGKKGRETLLRLKHPVVADYSDVGESLAFADISPLCRYLFNEFRKGRYDKIVVAYTHFVSVLAQKPVVRRLMPLGKDILDALTEVKGKQAEKAKEESFEYRFEPSPEAVLSELLPRLLEMQIYQCALESQASEHSARMVAMQNATEAAGELIGDLTLTYNKARQASITQEISEIVGGVEAMKN